MSEPTLKQLLANIPKNLGERALFTSNLRAVFGDAVIAAEFVEFVFESQYDFLTQVLTRERIFEKAESVLASVRSVVIDGKKRRRGRLGIAFIMGDLDKFKRINDELGHRVGDNVLAGAAQTIAKAIRPTDFIGRYGGEEFLIVLVGTTKSGAITAAENIRAAIQKGSFTSDRREVTISLGISYSDVSVSHLELIELADHAMNAAKRGGRNRVFTAYGPDKYRPAKHRKSRK